MRGLATRSAAVVAALWVGACDGFGAAPPTDLSLPDNAVAAALMQRVNGPDLPRMTARPGADPTPGCRDSYRVEAVTASERPAYGEVGSRMKVEAQFQARRLAPTDAAAANLHDCFGADPHDPPPGWRQGAVARVKGVGELTWRNGYWLLHIGDQSIPLPAAPASR